MSNVLVPNKESTVNKSTKSRYHFRNNSIKLTNPIPCIKCQYGDKRFRKKYDNIRSAYQHIVHVHSGADIDEYPSKKYCLEQLKKLSDSMRGNSQK